MIIAVVVALFAMGTVSANWYIGNKYIGSGYGGSSDITPSFIRVVDGHVYSWVSIPGDVNNHDPWIQAGWGIDPGLTSPYKYYEVCHDGCLNMTPTYYELHKTPDLGWGTTVTYQVSYQAGTGNVWCAFFNGYSQTCNHVKSPPIGEIQFLSEIQVTTANELASTFEFVKYGDANLVFWGLSQTNWVPSAPPLPDGFPYSLQIFSPENYKTFGYRWFYFPLITKN